MKRLLADLCSSDYKYILCFLLLGILTYSLSIFNNFIWLDKVYILHNPDLKPFDIHKIFAQPNFTTGGYYRPVTTSYYSILVNMFDDRAFIFKLFQFTIHLFNTTLLFILFKRFITKKLSFILALIFLVHPMNVGSTSYISAAAGALFFFFGISALLVSQLEKARWIIKFPAVFALLLLSFFSKEEGVFFGMLVLLSSFLFRRKEILITFLSVGLTATVYLYMRIVIARMPAPHFELVPIMQLSLIERLQHIPALLGYYLYTFLIPLDLAVNQQWTITSLTFTNFYLPMMMILSLLILSGFVAQRIRRKSDKQFKYFVFFFLWFSLGISIYLQIVPLDYTVANRWFYLPMAGLLGMLGIIISNLHIRLDKRFINVLVVIIILLLSARSLVRTTNWRSELTLFGHDSAITTNFYTEDKLGTALYEAENYQEAIVHFKKSVDMFAYDSNLLHLAQAYETVGDVENAKKYYLLAAQADNYGPGNHERIIYKSAARFLVLHDNVAARDIILSGLKEHPDSYRLLSLYAINEYQLGHEEEALRSAQETMQKYPNDLTKDIVDALIHQTPITLDQRFAE